ncbi:serine/threonine protein kinase [Cladophialophora carrionii]|uniref:Serine/threonine protein kinase n=1 Tax=Cladophialophora carrionii TaxID=86049 RepID=A0A1C1CW90_9EURO|nr:serine/threonine protein kinase [Cladophialophora carrionii]
MGFLHLDGTPVTEEILGMGGSGLIVRVGQFALKIPRLWQGVDILGDGTLTPEAGEYDIRKFRVDQISREKLIFKRLEGCRGVVPCYDLDSPDLSIRMKYTTNGNLRSFLEHEKPSRQTRLMWLTEMAHTLSEIHRRRVIVADIRSENFLIDNGQSIYITDFGESSLMPPDWNMKDPNADGESVMTDIGHFGTVMFEVITGQHCKFDLLQDWRHGDPYTWPRRETLPSTDGVWLGHIIEACWTKGSFASADDLAAVLDNERTNPEDITEPASSIRA